MWTDITAYLEVRDKNGNWQKVAMPYDVPLSTSNPSRALSERDYRMFALLSDVQNNGDIVSLAQPRGLPRDVSWQIHAEHERQCSIGHGCYDCVGVSYLTLRELVGYAHYDAVYEGLPLREWLNGEYWAMIGAMMRYGYPDVVRVVFWFDY